MYTCIVTRACPYKCRQTLTYRSFCYETIRPEETQWFKVWVVADGTNGFFMDIEVYVGRPSDRDTTEHGLGERVVLQLTEEFCNVNHWVFCGNYFTSPGLFNELLSHGIYACGTVWCDRREFLQQL